MKIKVLKLHTDRSNMATDLRGMITHWTFNMNGETIYVFQPHGLNKETGHPLAPILVERNRLLITISPEPVEEEIDIPAEILGTQVMHNPSGFTGKVILLIRHPHGCFHVMIQPQGTVPATGEPIKPKDFACSSCSGERILPR